MSKKNINISILLKDGNEKKIESVLRKASDLYYSSSETILTDQEFDILKDFLEDNYPNNPNGSINGICGFSSKCGRHLAMMPHPERCFQNYQVPYIERGDKLESLKYSPWILMFRNAFVWSTTNSFV